MLVAGATAKEVGRISLGEALELTVLIATLGRTRQLSRPSKDAGSTPAR
jgi:hypothetical protein